MDEIGRCAIPRHGLCRHIRRMGGQETTLHLGDRGVLGRVQDRVRNAGSGADLQPQRTDGTDRVEPAQLQRECALGVVHGHRDCICIICIATGHRDAQTFTQ